MMRNPGTEPLQITTGDVVALHKQIEAERLTHAAQVARLRAALERIHKGACLTAQESRSRDDDRYCLADVIEVSRAALAADPGPLVAALGEVVHAAYEVVGSVRARQAVFANAPPSRVAVDRLDSALAAYHAAIRGGKV